MKKQEFIDELKYNLEDRLPEQDILEVLSDYGDVFNNAAEEGKSEEEISLELGSPAKIARTILEEDELKKKEEQEARQREAAQRAEHERGTAGSDSKYAPFRGRMASMGVRLGAYLLDNCLVFAAGLAIVTMFMALSGHEFALYGRNAGLGISSAMVNMYVILTMLGAFNLVSALFIWLTNGYTPGKWICRVRVVKLSGKKLSFLDAMLRELVVKSLANVFTSGLLNVFSFIWGCVSDVRKTAHDVVADTTVVNVRREG